MKAQSSVTAVRQLAALLLPEVDAIAERLVTASIELDRDLYNERGPGTVEDLRRTAVHNVERIVQVLAMQVPEGVDPWDAAVTVGRRQAQQDLPIEGALRACRVGGQIIWERMVALARETPRFRARLDELLDGASEMWSVVEEICAAMGEAYREEELALRGHYLRLQGALIESLIDGRGSDPEFARDSARSLGIPLEAPKVCVIALRDGVGETVRAARETLAAEGISSIWHARQSVEIGLVALGSRRESLVRSLLAPCVSGPVGMSPIFLDLAELPSAYRLASLAAQTTPSSTRSVVSLDDVLVPSLLADSPQVGARIYALTIGTLSGLSDDERTVLVSTLRSYLAHDGAVSAAAAELYCHRNTVLHRLNKIETVSGVGTKTLPDKALWLLGLAAHS